MSYLAGIHDMAYVFTRVGASVDSGYRQDWVSLGANLAAAAGKATWYAKSQTGALKTALETVGKKVLPTPTAIIDVTMVAVAIVDLMNGFGPPSTAPQLLSAIDKLNTVDAKLEGAIPHQKVWSGDAAEAYKAQNELLRALVADLKELDGQMQILVAEHGARVKQAHQTLAILGFALVAGQGVALALYLVPIFGPELSMLFQVVAALAATTTVVVQETLVIAQSSNTADKFRAKATEYLALGQRGELGGEFTTIEVKQAPATAVGSFAAISSSMSTFSAAPTLGSLSALAGDSASRDVQAVMTAVALEEPPAEAPVDTPDGAPAPAPVPGSTFAPPTMAQLSAMSSKVAKMSSDVAQPLNVVNQTMGTVQQVVSMAQQGQTGAEPAPAEPDVAEPEAAEVPVYSDEDTFMTAGAETGERAPVEGGAAPEEPGAVPRQL